MQSFGLFYVVPIQRPAATSAISSTSCHSLHLLDRETTEPRSLELKIKVDAMRDLLLAKHLVSDAELYSVDSGAPD